MRRRAAIACLVLVLVGGGCSGDEEPVRIGMLADCTGLFAQSRELSLAAVSLPLLERGAYVADGGIVVDHENFALGTRFLSHVPLSIDRIKDAHPRTIPWQSAHSTDFAHPYLYGTST